MPVDFLTTEQELNYGGTVAKLAMRQGTVANSRW